MTESLAKQKPRAALAALLLGLGFAVSSCGLGSDGPDPTAGWTAEKLYAEAKAELSAGNLAQATRLFGRLESRYPFGRYAQQAQLELAYGHYRLGEKEQALSTLERFSKMYPSSPAMDYVFYLRGLIHFNDQLGLLVKLGGQSLADRDLKASRQAYDAFRVVLERYPNSAYADDADRKSTRLNSSHVSESRMPSSA